MTMINQLLLDSVIDLVKQVGHYQSGCFRKPDLNGTEKITREYVSEIDLNSEEMLKSGLSMLLPEAGFYGEETGSEGNADLRWVVDPLDGTTNFLSGLDQFSISVALEQQEQTQLGVVYRPQSMECYSALIGTGVHLNGKRCQCPHCPGLTQALIGTGFPYRSPDLSQYFFNCAENVLYRCRGIRRFGSAALDLSYVATGFLQGFWESDLQPYDVAAACLFLKERDILVTNQRGEHYSPYRDRIMVCGPPAVHAELLALVAQSYPHQL